MAHEHQIIPTSSFTFYVLRVDMINSLYSHLNISLYLTKPETRGSLHSRPGRSLRANGEWGHAIAREWATHLPDRLRDVGVAPPTLRAESSLFLAVLPEHGRARHFGSLPQLP
jgi:hypothetical protein